MIDIKEFDAANHQIDDLNKQLTDSMKTGDDKCDKLEHKLDGYRQKVKKQRKDIEKSNKELMSALCDQKEQAAINLIEEKKLDDAKVAASEIEGKLRKEIEALQKYVPSVSKPVSKAVETGKPWYAGYGREPVVHLVKDENALRLSKAIDKFKS